MGPRGIVTMDQWSGAVRSARTAEVSSRPSALFEPRWPGFLEVIRIFDEPMLVYAALEHLRGCKPELFHGESGR
jgi:hypothetical protein